MTSPWKLAKKLRDTGLGSFGFSSKASSSSTPPVPEAAKETPKESNSSSSKDASPRQSSSDDDEEHSSGKKSTDTQTTLGALTQAPVDEVSKPGILIVTVHEACGLSLPDQYDSLHKVKSSAASVSESEPRTSISSQSPPKRELSTSGRGFPGLPTIHGRISSKYMPYALLDFDKTQVFINSLQGTPENPVFPGANTQFKFDVSRITTLTIYLFMRNPKAEPGSGRTQDIQIGVVRVTPQLQGGDGSTGKESARGFGGVGWFDVQQGTGKLEIGVEFVENQNNKLSIADFDLLKVVGKGSFGKVMQVRKKDTNRIYALKTIRKAKIISRSEVAHTMAERSVLAQINNPFIVPLKFAFQSPEKLYFVLAFVNGGELFHHLTIERRFDINRARFYTAELLCVLECLHGFNVIYRDLKPENILLDSHGHIALCDFGLCKLEIKDEDQTNTFCGTPEYLAPELLHNKGYNKTVDWWTLGVLLYEMLTGLPPFYDENVNEMYRKILTAPLHFPGSDVVPAAAKDLLTKLLNRDPAKRLGANGSAEIKAHPFFHSIDWRKLLERKYQPTFKPNVASALDTTQISSDFTEEMPQDSHGDGTVLTQTMQDQFYGFSYNRPIAGLNDAGGSIKDPSYMDGPSSRR